MDEKELKLLVPPEEIDAAVKRLAGEIRRDYASGEPVLIGVLKGAFVFLSDLVRAIELPLEVDFIQASCYGKKESPSDVVVITGDISTDISGRDVIIVEGIIDRGHTARAVAGHLSSKGPSSIRLCTLLLRENSPVGMKVDYAGMVVGEGFVAGYGLDFKERLRGLSGLYVLKERG